MRRAWLLALVVGLLASPALAEGRMNATEQQPEKAERERALRKRLKRDFPFYAARCLKIRTKGDGLARLRLNEAQLIIHERLERQLREKGRVRALILKGRQQGASTYTEARYYWKVSHRKGVRAYILTHEDKATTNLFKMTDLYHEHCPPLVKPSTGAANANELYFDALASGYAVGTAGSKATGRSSTIQYFHGSEVAFWPNASDHMAGVLQAVPDAPGTEVILESTSDGPSGRFYEMCIAASKGEGDYELIFIPWFLSGEYRKPVPPGFTLTSEEAEYKATHGLDDEQMAWRRAKIVDLTPAKFRREYPSTVEEAFKVAAVGALWTPELLEKNRVREFPKDAEGHPLDIEEVVVAVDPSGGGGPKNDEVGILVGARASNGHAYLWRDDSARYTPNGWVSKVLAVYSKEACDWVVAEKNYGGDMVATLIENAARAAGKKVRVIVVTATRGKKLRAEPVVALYERGKVHHVGTLLALEDEMTTWVPPEPGAPKKKSPNRLDAAVFAVTKLLVAKHERIGSWSYWG